MALGLAAPAPISHRAAPAKPFKAALALPALWAAFLTLFVAGPWLLPGYLFGTDWPGPRTIPFATDLSSSALLQGALAFASRVIGGESTGKVLVLASLFSAALLSYRAVPRSGFVAGAVGATIYVVNPFVYGRLHYGQLYLIAAYAVLPWVALRLRLLLLEPRIATAILAAVSVTLLGVLNLHLYFMTAAIGGILMVAYLSGTPKGRFDYAKRLAPAALLAAVATLGASVYWIIPLLGGYGPEGTRLAGITGGDLRAFATIPDQQFGLLPNLLGLYGFWAERTGRFTSMKAFVPIWPVALGLLLALCSIGVIATFRKRDRALSPWVAGLLFCAGLALLLEMGISHPWTAGAVQWLDAHVPPYRGMRDAGKFAIVLALVYSQLAGLGAAAILDSIRTWPRGAVRREWAIGIATGMLLALPLYYGNGLLFGAHGEIKPSQYPSGWYTADRTLAADPHPGRALFLPWHQYMSYSFVRNQNSVVVSPASTFFSVPILASANPEVLGMMPPNDPDQMAIATLVEVGSNGQWAAVLARHQIKYVLLDRDLDWQSYGYLDHQPDLLKVGDFGSIVVYRNQLLT